MLCSNIGLVFHAENSVGVAYLLKRKFIFLFVSSQLKDMQLLTLSTLNSFAQMNLIV